ncbi:peptidoglycan D,D-transpeptidase FtsI family protein [Sulfuriflexus mobilis]|uniref:peptidoglycan D,D-transpeptidase FtsI family protein n=1 Tax=Sulfuriflexus mobilis TaxID=1811807 RepID=UPI000F83BC97|nr:penicillin-binding transpeptidase domain-containing protein [Sulfuriflexus mobilis]
MTTSDTQPLRYRFRSRFTLGLLLLAAALLGWRIVDLHVLRHDFLQGQGDARSLRVVGMAAHRGMITDRHGEPLAISTPVDSIWANPQELLLERERLPQLARALKMDTDKLQQILASRRGREFVYLQRHSHPDLAQDVVALGIAGVSLQREYRRYYPAGEVAGHLIGFTNIDDEGQEGIELAYDDWLRGQPGSKRVLKDRLGRIVENVESIRVPQPGGSMALSIDRRIQYLAYSELKAAVQKHKARSGSAVVLDIKTGEVLAMVNQPAFNPNNRRNLRGDRYRNRAVTDVFEPGSTMKPFTIAAALESGKFKASTQIQTAPGHYMLGANTVKDSKNYGLIDVATVLQKSSNVGASKMALALTAEQQWDMLNRVGFGEITSSGFPGESSGLLTEFRKWRDIDRATLSFGYGLSATLLQLAQAYSVFATDGYQRPLSLQRVDDIEAVTANQQRVMDEDVAIQVRHMLERVVEPGGTATRAAVPGYRVAGKTGTVRKSGIGGYVEERYLSLFAGLAPVSHPRLVMVVMVNEPSNGDYYGGVVAAPVFANVMAGALRLLNIAPDALPESTEQMMAAAGYVAGGRP